MLSLRPVLEYRPRRLRFVLVNNLKKNNLDWRERPGASCMCLRGHVHADVLTDLNISYRVGVAVTQWADFKFVLFLDVS